MTPLAQAVLRKAIATGADSHTLDTLSDMQCFELSEVVGLADEIARLSFDVLKTTLFLPAPRTWLEFKSPGRQRAAFLLEAVASDRIRAYGFTITESVWIADYSVGEGAGHWRCPDQKAKRDVAQNLIVLSAFLSIINTPKLVSRVSHPAHKGLARQVRREVGPIELRPWTTIKLELTPRLAGGEEHEARITGAKCLHFCRSHLRVRLGKLEIVRSHWRGDAALGVKSKDYAVVA